MKIKKKDETEIISRVEINRFAQGYKKKKHVREVTAMDAKWVLEKIQNTNFADIDKESDEMKVDFDKFCQYFIDQGKDLGLSQERMRQVFDEIDTKKQGKISVVAYEKWKSQQKAAEFRKTLNK